MGNYLRSVRLLLVVVAALAGSRVAEAGIPEGYDCYSNYRYNSNLVRAVQQTLEDHGINPGPIDGMYGRRTRDAVASFQVQNNLPRTGDLDELTSLALFGENVLTWNNGTFWKWEEMHDPKADRLCRRLWTRDCYEFNYSKQLVKQVEQALVQEGILRESANEIFDWETRRALIAYQQQRRLPTTAVIDESTIRSLLGQDFWQSLSSEDWSRTPRQKIDEGMRERCLSLRNYD